MCSNLTASGKISRPLSHTIQEGSTLTVSIKDESVGTSHTAVIASGRLKLRLLIILSLIYIMRVDCHQFIKML